MLVRASLFSSSLALALAAASAAAAQEPAVGEQAEWRQNYDAVSRIRVARSTTPILSPQALAATEEAIERYRDIASRGGWGMLRRANACASERTARAWSPCASASFDGRSGPGRGLVAGLRLLRRSRRAPLPGAARPQHHGRHEQRHARRHERAGPGPLAPARDSTSCACAPTPATSATATSS